MHVGYSPACMTAALGGCGRWRRPSTWWRSSTDEPGVASLDARSGSGCRRARSRCSRRCSSACIWRCRSRRGCWPTGSGRGGRSTLGLLAMGVGRAAVRVQPGARARPIAGRALVGAGDACMFLNVLRVAAHWLPPPPLRARRRADRGAAARSGSSSSTAPLERRAADVGWTPTFAASGVLTAVLAILAVNRLQDRPRRSARRPVAPPRSVARRTLAPRLAGARDPARPVGALRAQRRRS